MQQSELERRAEFSEPKKHTKTISTLNRIVSGSSGSSVFGSDDAHHAILAPRRETHERNIANVKQWRTCLLKK